MNPVNVQKVINNFLHEKIQISVIPTGLANANHHLCGKRERNGVQRRTKVSFSRTMMQALELLQWVKGTSWNETTLSSAKIKLTALEVLCLARLPEGISK